MLCRLLCSRHLLSFVVLLSDISMPPFHVCQQRRVCWCSDRDNRRRLIRFWDARPGRKKVDMRVGIENGSLRSEAGKRFAAFCCASIVADDLLCCCSMLPCRSSRRRHREEETRRVGIRCSFVAPSLSLAIRCAVIRWFLLAVHARVASDEGIFAEHSRFHCFLSFVILLSCSFPLPFESTTTEEIERGR
jgi:hypothetical protein